MTYQEENEVHKNDEEDLICPKCRSDLITSYSDDCEDSDGNQMLCDIHECHNCGQKFLLF